MASSTTLQPSDLLSIFTTAIEGGITSWAKVEKYHWTQRQAGRE